MEKLLMCRICLVENVRMFVVANKNLQEIYETLTHVPLVTEDSRPIHACYFCFSKLKQCCQFKMKCLEAEELFAQMLSCEQRPLRRRINSEFVGGLVKTSIENISIIDDGQAICRNIEVEVPLVTSVPIAPEFSEKPYEFIEVKVEHDSDDPVQDDVPEQLSRSDSDDDVPLLRIKTEVEEVEQEAPRPPVSPDKRAASDRIRAPAAKKPKLDKRRSKLEDTIPAERTKTKQQGLKVQTAPRLTIRPHKKRKNDLEEPFTNTKPTVDDRIENPIDTSCNSSDKDVLKCNTTNVKSIDNVNINKQDPLSTKEKPFKCDLCNRRYTVKSHLTCHIRSHTGERPYECDTCHRCFINKSHLKCHILTHTGIAKPFKCDVCQRRFSLKNNLRTHLMVHTGEKPYKCHICKRGFTQKIHLRSHIPIHTGEKPFKCDMCDRSFSLKHSVKRHIEIMHTDTRKPKYKRAKRAKRAKK
ncbi:hypothetical protein PYW08_012318 [Mythimna loreyi]|uniref:Uncharacterized protein n=1 Tax=Mythimna loreyi TaxID=667449 RepID=A0ACC2PZY1_9NEOP|nr:hypothetical protein PYW08_012318 [Mythimna loreyi]